MVITMRDYKQIRQMYADGISQRNIAQTLHISRNTVAKYCSGNAVPWERKPRKHSAAILTAEVEAFIRTCLAEDAQEGLKKQTHTAKRIYDRLVTETGFTGGESTVRRKVRELRNKRPQVFVPLEFSPGEAMQVDWGEAKVYLNGEKITVNLFCARLCSSCAPIVYAYRRQNEESFLDAFVRTFRFFGGVPRKVIFDNGRVAVKSGFGTHAQKQAGYTALCAHYAFDALFCNPAEGHEKGLVEGLVGWIRRNVLVPIPRVDRLTDLNTMLENRCIAYKKHRIAGKPASVGEMFAAEQTALSPLPGYPFETARCVNTRVNPDLTVRFDTNHYSVPYEYAGETVSVKGYPEQVEIYCQGVCIAQHERCFARKQFIFQMEHYLSILERRGRAIFNAKPVRQNLPSEFLFWLQTQNLPPKELVNTLRLCVEYGWENVWHNHLVQTKMPTKIQNIVEVQAVDLGAYDRLSCMKAGVC